MPMLKKLISLINSGSTCFEGAVPRKTVMAAACKEHVRWLWWLGFGILLVFSGFISINIAFCAGNSTEIISYTNTKEMMRFEDVNPEDIRAYLFQDWKDLESLARICNDGKLPNPNCGFEIIQQLEPNQLKAITHSILVGIQNIPGECGEGSSHELAALLSRIEQFTANLRQVFQEIIPPLCLLTGISFPLSMPLEENLPLLLKLNLSPETKAFYASQILNQVMPLLETYHEVFKLLPNTPELVFPEINHVETVDVNGLTEIEISNSEKIAVQAIATKVKQAFTIAAIIHKHRKRLRLRRRR